ncbi:MAG TPA: D-aminoacyl-tRNA deacylase [Kiritimatiellia bacterium]|nr:D-aminoacyl-tRNA deacylase [Kiritimatiellia bacterium]HMP33144.1 D-aminoacyl-tRNA deacylase [Kiritimatiellia bacterium]
MRLVIQRVSRASVSVEGSVVASIGRGFLILCGVHRDDAAADVEYLAQKTARLRVFDDAEGRMNLGPAEVGAEIIVVSQFTLYADCRKGNRPSYIEAAGPADGERWYESYVAALRVQGLSVQTGRFRTMMAVELVNDGPVTILMDSRDRQAAGA